MSAISFDIHQFIKKLETRGFSTDQAEGINDALKDALQVAEVSTKRDLTELEYRLTIKLGVLMTASVGIVATLVKLL
jgi:hypothetical protein